MSNIDKQALREAAEKATPGDWRRASTRFNGITAQASYPLCGKEEILANTSEKRDAEFIAAANPATVLALLDELDNREKLRAAANRVVNQQDIELQELRQRVAELEAREVTLPKIELVGYGDWPMFDANLVTEAIRAAGIRINGEG